MTKHLEQVKHNENFHSSLCSSYSEHYFDWKITCLFYISLHLLKALAHHWGVDPGDRHTIILRNMNPKMPNRNFKVKSDVFYSFDRLFEYSRTARYDGFTDFNTFQQLKKADYIDALKICEYIKNYVRKNGVPV